MDEYQLFYQRNGAIDYLITGTEGVEQLNTRQHGHQILTLWISFYGVTYKIGGL